jgi:hypothetical protein|nr:MAG TPA: hypothetical protein [Caudoviricetes sp.]
MNQLTVTINGTTYENIVIPFKFEEILDEQLDSATLTLSRVNTEVFNPDDPVEVVINDGESTQTKYYRIAQDSAYESPNGSGFYRHELLLIENTKDLENYMVESLCVTNAGGRMYKQTTPQTDGTVVHLVGFPGDLKTPTQAGTMVELFNLDPNQAAPPVTYYTGFLFVNYADGTREVISIGQTGVLSKSQIEIKGGINRFVYDYSIISPGISNNYSIQYNVFGQSNYYPLKPWTLKEVIDRALELAEPLIWDKEAQEYVKEPRFKFRYKTNAGLGNAEERALFAQYSPEFTFTRCTLRELLQEIGGFIHAEPRLDQYNTVYFDRYGEQEVATYYDFIKKERLELNQYNYTGKTVSYGIEQACTRVDSYVDNLVNQISIGKGTVGQPYQDGYQSMRTDSSYIRFTESNMIFPTVFPVLQPIALRWVDYSGIAGAAQTRYDITPYLFEKSIYDSQLSSYTDVYPASKAFALYYTQGEKNIGGLFFKVPEWTGGARENYAIVNILRAVTGKNDLDVSDYTKLCFELVYIPTYSARVGHSKQYIGDWLNYPRSIAQNQSANMVETQYYGENIKGLAERLGTIEKTYTFYMMHQSNLPTAGKLWDDSYYISTVSVEILSDRFKCTIGLSKNFNRKSKYIGANSYKRIFEVSERMVQERQSIYTDYLIITSPSTMPPASKRNVLMNMTTFVNVRNTFYQALSSDSSRDRVSAVIIQGETKNGKEVLPKVILPVIASAFGNVMEFSWEFQDNYSAGMRAIEAKNGSASGMFGQEVQYCDYYGRMYYENFNLYVMGSVNAANPFSYPLYVTETTPGTQSYAVAGTYENYPIIKRKDSREAIKENYGIEYVTDLENIIIGSALAANNPMVSGVNAQARAKLVILRNRINKFSRKVNLSTGIITGNVLAEYELGAGSGELNMTITSSQGGPVYLASFGLEATVAGKAWALVTPVYYGEPYTVEDEDGNVSSITPEYGGELLIGCNQAISIGDVIAKFNIVGCHDVFEYLKEK